MRTFAPFLLILLLLPGCTGPKRVSAAEFKRRYARVGLVETLHTHTYLGQNDGRAYIRARSMSLLSHNSSEKIIYAELRKLDPAFRDSLPKEGITNEFWRPTIPPKANPAAQPRSGSGN